MENIKIEIPKVPTFKISIPQYGTGAGTSIAVDSEMSNTSTNPVQNKVVKEYVDDGFIKRSTEYGLTRVTESKTGDKKHPTIIVLNDDVTVDQLNIPAYTSDLHNDSGFITSDNLQAEIEKIFPNGDIIGYPTANKEGD